jgi:hypothetical protein
MWRHPKRWLTDALRAALESGEIDAAHFNPQELAALQLAAAVQAGLQKFALRAKTRFSPFPDSAGYTIVMRWQRRFESRFLMTKRSCW